MVALVACGGAENWLSSLHDSSVQLHQIAVNELVRLCRRFQTLFSSMRQIIIISHLVQGIVDSIVVRGLWHKSVVEVVALRLKRCSHGGITALARQDNT